MSVAVVTGAPTSCSGAAYSGVSARLSSRVSAAASGLCEAPVGVVAVDELCDPEVEQLHAAVDAHEDVGGLDVAVDDQAGMRVGDAVEHVEEQPQASLHVERACVGVAIDRLAVHELEDEIRLPVLGDSRVGELGDVRVLQSRQDAALAPEPLLTGAPHE